MLLLLPTLNMELACSSMTRVHKETWVCMSKVGIVHVVRDGDMYLRAGILG